MTPEEREEYVGQDEVKRGWREIPASDRLESMGGGESLADLFRPGGYLSENSVLHALLAPVEVECLRMFYGEGQSCGQIAKKLSQQFLVGKRVVETTGFTRNRVYKLIRSAQKKLLRTQRQDNRADNREE